jgi:hypothetical protein
MKTFKTFFKLVAALGLTLGVFSGCESTDAGSVSGSGYYGVGFYDPWYYGGGYDHRTSSSRRHLPAPRLRRGRNSR